MYYVGRLPESTTPKPASSKDLQIKLTQAEIVNSVQEMPMCDKEGATLY